MKIVPKEVYSIVCSLCADYNRRAEAIEAQAEDMPTLLCYVHYNDVVDRAIASVCEEGIRNQMRLEIAGRIGLQRTKISYISDGTFKRRKQDSIHAIAKALHLV